MATCAVNGRPWIDRASKRFIDREYCPRHMKEMFHGFDPRLGSRVGLMEDRIGAEYLVVQRWGSHLRVRPIGFKNSERQTVTVFDVYPINTKLSADCG